MLILDKPQLFRGDRLVIPLYHRGHLSLFAGTKIWLCLVPGSDPHNSPEIIISPINYAAWQDLWRISVTTQERSGVVNKILRALQRLKINVIAEESSSIERQRRHTIELVVDARKYFDVQDDTTERRQLGLINSLPDLERALLAEILPDVALSASGEPKLGIRRLEGLFDAAQAYSIAANENAIDRRFEPVVADTEVEGAKGILVLPQEIKESLNVALRGGVDSCAEGSRYLLVSDTRDRYLRVYFFKANDLVISVTIEHEERIGALARITSRLYQSGFNILTSLSRLYIHGGKAQYELVLQAPKGMTDEKKMRATLEASLRDRALVKEYKPALSYKLNYRVADDFVPLTPGNGGRSPSVEREAPDESTLKRLVSQYALFLVKTAKPEDRLRFSLAQRLLDEERRVRGKFSVQRILFVSYAFDDEARFELIKKEAKKKRFDLRVGRHLGAAQVHRDGVMRIITECTHFLGIWTAEGGRSRGKGKIWPSSWLLWELAVAEALGKRPRLLISKQIQDAAWKDVYPERPHTMFGPDEFLTGLQESLEILASEPAPPAEQRLGF